MAAEWQTTARKNNRHGPGRRTKRSTGFLLYYCHVTATAVLARFRNWHAVTSVGPVPDSDPRHVRLRFLFFPPRYGAPITRPRSHHAGRTPRVEKWLKMFVWRARPWLKYVGFAFSKKIRHSLFLPVSFRQKYDLQEKPKFSVTPWVSLGGRCALVSPKFWGKGLGRTRVSIWELLLCTICL